MSAVRSDICPHCGRSVALTKASYFKSHRTIPGRFGRGPYCAGSGNMPTGPKAKPEPLSYTVARVRGAGQIVLTAPNGETVEYHREAIACDVPSCGSLKIGDRLKLDPDGLCTFIRVGDFR